MDRSRGKAVMAGGVLWLGVPDRPWTGVSGPGSSATPSTPPVQILGNTHGPRILELVRTRLADRTGGVNARQDSPQPDPTWRNHR